MKITSDHQIDVAKQIFSPNHSEQKIPPEIIVLHCISLPEGHFGNDNIIELFTNKLDCKKEEFSSLKDLKVSSHLLINRNGKSYNLYHLIKLHGMQEYHSIRGEKIVMISQLGLN